MDKYNILQKCKNVRVFTSPYLKQLKLDYIKKINILYNILHYYLQLYNINILNKSIFLNYKINYPILGHTVISITNLHNYLQGDIKNGI